jgi:hypothetical protein
MRIASGIVSVVVAALLLAGLGLPSTAQAQKGPPGKRADTWEFVLPITYQNSATIAGDGGSSMDVNSDLGMGLGFAYNLNNHFQLGGLMTWSTRSYDATVVGSDGSRNRVTGYLDTSTISFNGTVYFLDSNFTPYVSAGIGSTFVDSNVPSGPPVSPGVCYWVPEWGYVCDNYVPTYTATAVSYLAGAGVRWDLTRVFSLQGSYNKLWIDTKDKLDFDGLRLDLVFRM